MQQMRGRRRRRRTRGFDEQPEKLCELLLCSTRPLRAWLKSEERQRRDREWWVRGEGEARFDSDEE